jgi:hypothetical protein
MPTTHYPYATPTLVGDFGQTEPDLEAFKHALVSTQKSEESLRQRYAELMAWVSLGGIPGVVVRDYMDAAAKMNRLLRMNFDLFQKSGGTGVMIPVPTVRVRRTFKDTDVLTAADLAFEPCPQPPMAEAPALEGLGIAMANPATASIGRILASYGARTLFAVACLGGIAWTVREIGNAIHGKKYEAEIQGYISQAKVAEQRTQQQKQLHDAFEKQMKLCMGTDTSKYFSCLPKVAIKLAALEKELPGFERLDTDKGLGFFGWLGVIVFVGSVATAGYVIWSRRRQQRLSIEVTEKEEESEGGRRLRREAALPA